MKKKDYFNDDDSDDDVYSEETSDSLSDIDDNVQLLMNFDKKIDEKSSNKQFDHHHYHLNQSLFPQTKRIIWGKEIPNIIQQKTQNNLLNDKNIEILNDNSIIIMGKNPLITIRSINNKDDLFLSSSTSLTSTSLTSSSSTTSYDDPNTSRIFKLENLHNYFKLIEPKSSASIMNNKFHYEYFLSLLDPTMPRLTNCNNYYRMRYAVYVAKKNNNYEIMKSKKIMKHDDDYDKSKRKLVHIGEIHLYTIVPESTLLMKRYNYNNNDKNLNNPYIHYENISFFSSQIPLSNEELNILQLSNNNEDSSSDDDDNDDINTTTTTTTTDFTSIVNHFREYLKYLNTIIIDYNDYNYDDEKIIRTTSLLVQLKYPKTINQFMNIDRLFYQFNRLQQIMIGKYFQKQQQQQQQKQYLSSSSSSSSSSLILKQKQQTTIEQQQQQQQIQNINNESEIITNEIFIKNLLIQKQLMMLN